MTELSESVASLIEPRLIPTEQLIGGVSRWTVIKHESLLELLVNGAGGGRGPGSSEIGLIIDVDALEVHAQIIDRVREWCLNAHTAFRRSELAGSIRTWAEQFQTLYDAQNVADEVLHDHIRQLDTWAKWIEDKFNPDKKLEWPLPCPRCGTKRIQVQGPAGTVEQFAVEINLTKQTVTCRALSCDEHWYGVEGMVAFMNEHDGIASKTELRKLLDLNT